MCGWAEGKSDGAAKDQAAARLSALDHCAGGRGHPEYDVKRSKAGTRIDAFTAFGRHASPSRSTRAEARAAWTRRLRLPRLLSMLHSQS